MRCPNCHNGTLHDSLTIVEYVDDDGNEVTREIRPEGDSIMVCDGCSMAVDTKAEEEEPVSRGVAPITAEDSEARNESLEREDDPSRSTSVEEPTDGPSDTVWR